MSQTVATVPAATILLLRDTGEGLEVFMVVRHHQIDFASGALVFPGGKIDAGDYDVREYCCTSGTPDDTQLALMAGAIREAYEESGVLLARRRGEDTLISAADLAPLEANRDRLNNGDVSLREFLERHQLELACDVLQHYSHWITPEMMPKRFDTHFYLAAAPADQLALHDGKESVDSVWIEPEDALRGATDGRYTIIFPTRLNIEMLAESDSLDSAMAMASARDIVPVLPWIEQRDDGNYLCIPEEAGYKISAEKMAAPGGGK